MKELILLKITVTENSEAGEATIRAITPVSTVELTAETSIAKQIHGQLAARLLETIESEMIELKGDMES